MTFCHSARSKLLQRGQRDDAGVVHQHVELAELADGGVDRGLPLLGLGDVEVDVARSVADVVGQRLALVVEDVADHDLGALLDEHPCVRGTHAAGAAADERNLSVHASHAVFSFSLSGALIGGEESFAGHQRQVQRRPDSRRRGHHRGDRVDHAARARRDGGVVVVALAAGRTDVDGV